MAAAHMRPSFRVKSIKQLVQAATSKETTEPSYSFSNGRSFNRRAPSPGSPSAIDGYTDLARYTDLENYTEGGYVSAPPPATPTPGGSYTGSANYTDMENYE